jgi:RNA polymerase-binding transcription factor DksA
MAWFGLYDQSDKRKRVTMKLSPPSPLRGKKITPRQLLQQQARLLRVRAVLLQRIKRLTEDASEETPGYSIHMADAGTDSFDRDLTLGLATFEQEALYEVDAALQRINDGTYGVCELTGRPIPWKRLEAIPWTRFSFEAEVQLETLFSHPHIGSLRTVQPEGEEPFEAPFDLQGESWSGGSTENGASRLVSEENVS